MMEVENMSEEYEGLRGKEDLTGQRDNVSDYSSLKGDWETGFELYEGPGGVISRRPVTPKDSYKRS
jgi:hypothetical protein